MKTAMQELIEEIQYWKEKAPVGSAFKDILIILEGSANNSLEKEKEQIVNAFEVGYKSCDLDEAFEINRKLASGELYYKKTY